jgi:hypothetical protein
VKYPKGYNDKAGFTKIAINFPNELFHDILIMARREGKDFSSMVSELCKVGIFDLEESDRLEN